LTRKETAQRLKVSESTVDRWIRTGVLTARRWGHTIRIPEENLRQPKAEETPDG
jgi:excisionase family DNA binding protein